MTHTATPVGGPLLTRPMKVLLVLFAVGAVLLAWRFLVGLGPPTALSDGYPWGLWIAFDVVTGTALACGGYAIALLVYIANKGKYHPLVRPALLTSAIGYTLGGVGVMIDIGRYWWVWKLPIFFWRWNLSSILLEVALCIMLYMFVLWIELSPAILERWTETGPSPLRRFAVRTLPILERAMPFLIALGLLLPTMHQSSLGSLMLLAGHKLHPLWHTSFLPLLFLISVVGMGYAVVIMETSLATTVFGRARETDMLSRLAMPIVVTLVLFMGIRIVDILLQGKLPYVLAFDVYSITFLVEMGLFALATVMLLRKSRLHDLSYLFKAALVMLAGGILYRFSAYLIAFNPGPGWSYFPSVPEMLISAGLVAAGVVVYILLVKRFPILSGAPQTAH